MGKSWILVLVMGFVVVASYNACSPVGQVTGVMGSSEEGSRSDIGSGAEGSGEVDAPEDSGSVPRRAPPDVPDQWPTNSTLSDIPFNTALDLGPFTCQGIEGGISDGCARLVEFSGFVYDPLRHQMVLFGGGHATVMNNDIKRFNLQGLKWQGTYTPNTCASHTVSNFDSSLGTFLDTGYPASTHTYDLLVISQTYGELVKMYSGGLSGAVCNDKEAYWGPKDPVHVYNFEQDQWHVYDDVFKSRDNYPAAELDPIEDWTLVVGNRHLQVYDNVEQILLLEFSHGLSGISYAQHMVYFPPNDKFYYFGGTDLVVEIALSREAIKKKVETGVESEPYFSMKKVSLSGDKPTYTNDTGFAYDSHNQLIGTTMEDGVFHAFDPTTGTWYKQSVSVQSAEMSQFRRVSHHAIDFDPVNGVYIVIDKNSRTWAYRW